MTQIGPDVRLCFLIPASPTDGFRGQIAMFRRALDNLGGIYEKASVVAVFGDETITEMPDRWRAHFQRIIVRHVDPEDFKAHSYLAQGDARWAFVPDNCDFAIFSDADTLVLRPFDEVLGPLVESPGIAGSIAHYPFPQFPGETPREKWQSLGRAWLGAELSLTYEHTLVSAAEADSLRLCPFYVNFGFVVVSRSLVDPIGSMMRRLRPAVAPMLSSPYFAGQVALTLAVHGIGSTRHALDIRYNFPNDPTAEALHPESLEDVRVIHYLRTGNFDRQQIFADAGAFESFMDLRLAGSELEFQEHVRRITQGRYPF